jgi:mono/diheme cytochrome c family protein
MLLLGALWLAACDYGYVKPEDTNPVNSGDSGGGVPIDTSAQSPTVVITPSVASIRNGQTRQLAATVMGNADQSVFWSIASGPGSVSADGLYTAPATVVGDPLVVTVRATAKVDTTAFATAVIVVTQSSGTGGTGSGGGDTLLPGEICFERDVLPIFQSNCAMSGCHDAATQQKGYTFTSYAGIVAGLAGEAEHPDRSEILEKITETRDDKRMPPPPKSPLTAAQIETIRNWIAQGAKETKCSGTGHAGGGCDTTNVTFSTTVFPVLQNNCFGCHSGANPPLGVHLDSYAGVKAVVDDERFRKAINHLPGASPMPKGGNMLPGCTLNQINAWIDRGAPNN